ncbi:superoxide dismutase [Neisseria shayeganii 871]|uniref:Superoxide dismutase n=1 Tax=Neisseria shayeganii 871 TaxID=1032488 RepID=G4CK15_9NEIS|nr:superoxide dismutase [Neisseria shayeganii 871]
MGRGSRQTDSGAAVNAASCRTAGYLKPFSGSPMNPVQKPALGIEIFPYLH